MKFQKTSKIITLVMLVCLVLPMFTAYATQPTHGYTPSGVPFTELESRIDAIVTEHLGVSTPGVAVVVVSEGEVIFLRGYGYADIENGILVNPETTAFRHGSINKVFVWLAVMQLVEQGLLDLDVDVATYLSSNFLNQVNFTQSFTMRDLMNHTAGFEEAMLDIMFDLPNVQNHITLEQALVLTRPAQIYEVGMIRAYSNWGSALAAFVVEQISGVSYYVFERENILQPLGMFNTLNQPDWLNNHAFLQNVVQGYSRVGAGRFNIGVTPYITLYPAGATLGTVADMAYLLKYLTETDQTFYGFMPLAGTAPNFGHGGGTAVSSTLFTVEPSSRFGFAVFTNVNDEMPIILGIHDLLMGNAMSQVPPSPSGLPSATAVAGNFTFSNRFAGFAEFVNYLAFIRVTAIDDNTIEVSMGGTTAVYRQIEPYVFSKISIDGQHLHLSLLMEQIRFNFDGGRLTHGSVSGGGFDLIHAERSMAFLIGNLIIVIAAVLFFLVVPIAMLVKFIIRKRKGVPYTRFELATSGLLLAGTLFTINNVIWTIHVVSSMFMVSASSLAHYVWINYVLVGLSVVLLAVAILFFIKDKSEIKMKSKVFLGATAVSSALFISVLQYWNFFVLL